MAKFVSASLIVGTQADVWSDWKYQFGKQYNGDEDTFRHEVFNKNLAFIEAENAKGHSHTLGLGPFTAMTTEEYKALLGSKPEGSDTPTLGVHSWQGETLADSIDWTTQGVVTPVKDQGQCGSCWAFSTTGALESGFKLHSGNLVSFSEQQFVDCDGFPNLGCNGGNMMFALRYSKKADICTEASYPYEATGGSCRKSGCTVGMKSGTVTGLQAVAPLIGNAKDEDMKSALQIQPLSIAIEADQDIFQHYKSGTITGSCGTKTDHGVLAVGYGTDSEGYAYWKVKNSWGSSWGDDGYVMLVQGKNQCGINTQPRYPLFGSSVQV